MKLSRELKLGVFTLLVVVLSFFVINYLRGKDIFNREMMLWSHYADVEGLVPSDPVYIKGFKAGSVYSVDYNTETGVFDVSCSILRKFRIPDDSKMTIYSRDIMGGKAIRIDLGKSSSVVSEGSELTPASQPDMMASISDAVIPITQKLTETMTNIDSVAVSLKGFLNETNGQAFSRTLADLEKTMAGARQISEALGGKSEELVLFIDNLSAVSEDLTSVMEKADSAMTNVASVTASLDSADFNGAVQSFKTLLESVQDPDGTIGKLIYDGKVYDSVDSLLVDVDQLIRKVKDNPRKFIKISLF